MTEIFISYARLQAETAHAVADALRRQGWVVWRDDDLPPHRAYSDVIEERLNEARAVLVLWSADAVQSQWVRAEADCGRKADKLVQISLDGVVPPLPFNQIQCDEIRWPPGPADKGWSKVLGSLSGLCKAAPRPAPAMIRPDPAAAIAAAPPMLAVLAFDNMSNDVETGYFSDGVAEDVLQAVARAGYIKVAGRLSSFCYRGAAKIPSVIAADLGCTHILDGSVRRGGNRLRISASLIECATQSVVWSGRFDREVADIFVLQDEIAEAVATALAVPLTPQIKAARIDPAAYDLYLQARAIAGDPWHASECIRLLEQCVAKAPGFAAAWASLATAIAVDMRFRDNGAHCGQLRPAAIAAAERAVAIDASSAPAYVALSLCQPIAAFDAREALLKRALAAQENDVHSLKFAADFAQAVGRTREGFELCSRAHGVDPLNWLVALNYATALDDIGFAYAAREAYDSARARWPDMVWFTATPLATANMTGNWAEAERLFALPIDWGQDMLIKHRSVTTLLRAGDPDLLKPFFARAERQLGENGRIELSTMMLLQAAGQMDALFELIDRSSFASVFDPDGPPLDRNLLLGAIFGQSARRMRTDRRFVGLCARLGLVQYWQATGKWPDCADEVAGDYDFRAEAALHTGERPT